MRSLMDGWSSYFISGTLAIIMSWALTGCRFGNRIVDNRGPDAREYSGFYLTEPQSLEFCATKGTVGSASENCVSDNVTQIPELATSVFSNPVGLISFNKDGRGAVFNALVAKDIPSLPVTIDPETGDFLLRGTTPAQAFWRDYTECTNALEVDIDGDPADRTESDPEEMSGLPISGTVSLDVIFRDVFSGTELTNECPTVLDEMATCYEDESKCGGADADANSVLFQITHILFEDYISRGVFTVNDLADIVSVEFRVSYR